MGLFDISIPFYLRSQLNSVKVLLRLFEVTGLADPGLATFEADNVRDEKDVPLEAYALPTLSDYAVPEDGSMELTVLLQECSLEDLVREVLASRGLMARQKGMYCDLLKVCSFVYILL